MYQILFTTERRERSALMSDQDVPRHYDAHQVSKLMHAVSRRARLLGVSLGARVAGGSIGQQLIRGYMVAVLRRGLEPSGGVKVARYAASEMGRYVSELRHPGIATPLAFRVLRETGAVCPLSEIRLGVVAVVRESGRTTVTWDGMVGWEACPDVPSSVPGKRLAVALVAIGILEDGASSPIAATLLRDPARTDAPHSAYADIAEQLRLVGSDAPVYVDSLRWPAPDVARRAPDAPLSGSVRPGDEPLFTDAFSKHGMPAAALVVDDDALATSDEWVQRRLLVAGDQAELGAVWTRPNATEPSDVLRVSDGTGFHRHVRTSVQAHDREAIARIARTALTTIDRNDAVDERLREIKQRGSLELGVTTRAGLLNRLDADMLEQLCCVAQRQWTFSTQSKMEKNTTA